MADFKTHISTSCAIGVVYGLAGYYVLDLSAPACLLSAAFCGVAGMLPDLDSDTGVPLRETLAFGGAAVSLLMMERWRQLGFTPESMALAGMITYLVVRFGFGEWLRANTVHRGMFHSLPAAVLAGLLAFLVCHTSEMHARIFKASAIFCGFMIHLILDEI
ncbi:MAG TPA: metal-dependent hydrolase, partial [Pirellulales bacterium]